MSNRYPGAPRRWWAALPVLAVALVLWLAMGRSAPAAEGSQDATVTMTDTRFAPAAVRVKAGQQVTWRNTSSVAHTVTADPELAQDPSSVRLPEGASPFHSGIVAPGSNYTRTFTVRGTYVYICVPHEGQGMVGRIVVE